MRKIFNRFVLPCLAAMLVLTCPVAAQTLNVDIVGGQKSATPIVIVPFAQGSNLPTDVADVMRNDFNRSGRFRALPKSEIIEFPSQGGEIKFATWKQLRQDYIVLGRVSDAGSGMLRADFELWDVNQQKNLLTDVRTVPTASLRDAAHQAADAIWEKLTGIRGAFWTRIAYITAVGLSNNMTYSLVVADSDGFNPRVVARSHEALLSPSWSPDGNKIAYVSFESGNSAIYIQDITTGARQLVSARTRGINGAPAWSPEGSKLAISLSDPALICPKRSCQAHPELFVLDLASRNLTRLTTTNYPTINTEPSWSADGKSIDFTSDRSGRPQIYRVSAGGGDATRITFQGQSNANVDVSYDDKLLAMVQSGGNALRIAIMDQSLGGQMRFISPGPVDEGPSFAPNASMLIYAAIEGQQGMLYAVSVDGSVRQRLALANGDVRAPAWGPYRQR